MPCCAALRVLPPGQRSAGVFPASLPPGVLPFAVQIFPPAFWRVLPAVHPLLPFPEKATGPVPVPGLPPASASVPDPLPVPAAHPHPAAPHRWAFPAAALLQLRQSPAFPYHGQTGQTVSAAFPPAGFRLSGSSPPGYPPPWC